MSLTLSPKKIPDVRIVLQHVLQHSVGAGGGGVQLDDLAAHVGAVVIQRPFIVDQPLSARALVGQAAAVAARLFLGVCTVEVGGIQRDPPALAAVQNIVDVQGTPASRSASSKLSTSSICARW